MQQDERHTASEKENGEQGADNDKHRCLSCRHACVAQKHELRHSASCRTRRQKCEKVIAENDLHRLVERDMFIRYLHEMHEPAAIKKETDADSEHRQCHRP